MRVTQSAGRRVPATRFSRTLAVCALTMTMGTIWSATSSQSAPAAAPAMSREEMYKNVYNGWKWWHVYCYRCHGTDANGTPLAPNLTDLNRKVPLKEFLKNVRDGFPDEGMQAWSKLLDDNQITQLYYYVMARTDKVLPPGRPDEVGPNKGPWVPPANWPKN
jgi:mono/diheme cytochrome c family protein